MRLIAKLKRVLGWMLCAAVVFFVGSFLGFLGLRLRGLRAEGEPADWIDASVGIALILVVACALLIVRIRFAARSRRPADQRAPAAAGAPRRG
jgi:hypothetical protein